MTDSSMHVCDRCGVVRAGRKAKCPHCGAAYETSVQAPSRHGDDFYWVCIECTFKCRMCGFDVPLNHLDMDGAVLCARCGLEQAFQVIQWQHALNHAQNTGDTWTDSDIGENKSSAVLEGGENDFRVTASPGYPRCETCHAQLEIAADDGTTTTTCACGEKASYEVPPAARKMMRSLQAVIAAEHRTDRRAVKVEQGAAAIAVACPSCNAPLEANETSKFLTCTFCKTTSRIPDRTWFRISGKDPKAEPMWLLFHGPSPRRVDAEYERQRARDEIEEEKARAKRREELQREREKEQEERTRQKREKEEAERLERAAAEEQEARAKRDSDRNARNLTIGLSVAAIAFVFGGAFLISRANEKKPTELQASVAACGSGDGKACTRAGDLSTGSTQKDRYEAACNASWAPGCTKRADLASGETAIRFYQRGCTGGDKPACDAMEKFYMSGQATPKDPLLAEHYKEMRCAKGTTSACVALGLDAQKTGDDGRAVPYFRTACDAADPQGCDQLGHCYESGTGVKTDLPAMLLAYQTACNRQQTWCYDLGRVYQTGLGVQKNEAKAIGLYTQACSDGNQKACAAVRK